MRLLKFAFVFGFIFFLYSADAQEEPKAPKASKSEFSTEALAQKLTDLSGNITTVGEVFAKHKGKIILLDVWASWCPDCIVGLPEIKDLQTKYPDLVYLFFSLDRKEDAWKKGIEKYEIAGEHYWFNTPWENDFTKYIELNWIPRYLLIDSEGKIAHYYAIHADDASMAEKINELEISLSEQKSE